MPADQNDGEPPDELAPTREIEAEQDAFVGRTIGGRYEIRTLLGEGAMGAVYRAEHVRIGREDAIKLLHPDLADDDDAWARFTREARNASHINHPNVCTVYDFGETDDGLPYIAMEFVDGETLTALLEREGALAPTRVAEINGDIAAALEAAHSRGIVHRDLKPDNVMLTGDESGSRVVKVVDFGIAKAVQQEEGGRHDVTREGFVLGTPQYVSPEQVAGEELTPRSDIYSLGIVLYEMLTGRLPFRAETWQKVMTKRLSEEPIPLREAAGDRPIGAELERVIRRCLRRDPEARYESAEALQRDLLDAVGESGQGRVPPTRDVNAAGGGSTVLRPGDGSFSWRTALYAAAILGLGGTAAYAGLQAFGNGDAAPGAGSQGSASSGAVAAADSATREPSGSADDGGAEDTSPDDAGSESPGPATSPGDDRPPSTDPTSDPGEETATAAAGPTDRPADDAGNPDGTGSSPALADLSPAQVDSLLFRQQDRLSFGDPGPAGIRAAGDTARLVWRSETQPDSIRGLAAYTLARSLLQQGDTSGAEGWLERAVGLAPDADAYRRLLESVRASTR